MGRHDRHWNSRGSRRTALANAPGRASASKRNALRLRLPQRRLSSRRKQQASCRPQPSSCATKKGDSLAMRKTVGPRPQLQAPAAAALQAKLKKAVAFHQQGNLAEAERIYREILQRLPNHFNAMHLLGAIAAQTLRPDIADELIGKAIGINAKVADAHSNRGNARPILCASQA